MSLSTARQDIAGMLQNIKTAWVAYPLIIETDNRNNVDYATQDKPFLQADVVFFSAEQLDLSITPFTKQYGQIILSAVVKDGTGVVDVLALLDFAIPYVERKTLSKVRTETAEVVKPKVDRGLYYQPVIINFSFIR